MQQRAAKLNPEQQRAVDHGDGPLLILAGAGTGKTRVLVHRVAAIIRRGVAPWDILAVTFSNKAAGEMRERLRDLLGVAAERMWIGTFHGTCARLLRIHGEHIGVRPDFTIFDDDDQKRVLAALLKETKLDSVATPQGIRSRIDRAKNRGLNPLEAYEGGFGAASELAAEILATIYPLYRDRLQREGAVDFNDLLLSVLRLANHPEVGPALGARFRHVLVDEFQDTNRVQYRLVKYWSQASRNLTVVGDDDQSIYSWRGAEPKNLLEFDRDFADATVIKLEQNYRSTQTILDAANRVIAHNRQRHDKALWTDSDPGEPILLEECSDERTEADFIARAMTGLVQEEGRDYGDLAVLYRTHAQSRVLEEQLRRYRIAYRIAGGVSFFQRREIKDALAYLRLVLNSDADSCYERIVNVPARGIGKTTVERIRGHARKSGVSLLEATRAATRGLVPNLGAGPRRKLAAFLDVIDGLRDVVAAGASVSESIIQAVERSGYRDRLDAEDTPEADERLDNLAELVAMASDFDEETGGKGTLIQFDERLSLSSANDGSDGRGTTAVTLMTIHAAKGLEFPVIFLCGMEDGLFPSLRSREGVDEDDSLEEERRLAYVAMTRAQERLIVTHARTRRRWGEVRINKPSRFLDEIPTECLAVRARPKPRVNAVRAAARARAAARRGSRPDDPHADVPRGSHADPRPHPPIDPAPGYDEFDQRPRYDDVPEYHVDDDVPRSRRSASGADAIGSGTAVSHTAFGEGRVIQAEGSGKQRKLLIDFDDHGLKTVLARFVQPL